MANLLVTGGCGFIGSAFVRLALEGGHRVIVLDALTYAGHRENLTNIPGANQPELVVGEIGNPTLVASLLKEHSIDYLVNFAAESHVDRSITGPAAFITTNILGTFNLLSQSLEYFKNLQGSKKENFRYLQISTDEVYGALGETGQFSETTAYAPNSPYSASKAGADHLVRAWHHTYALPTITTNCSNNYGPRQFPEKLMPLMITNAVSGKALPVYGKGQNVRDWIHVEDHCAGIWLALTRGKPGSTYCFGGNAEKKNLDVVHQICRELDTLSPRKDGKPHTAGISYVTDRLGHDWRYSIDDTLAQKELGFKRKYTFESGLVATIRWYLDNSAWITAVQKKGAT